MTRRRKLLLCFVAVAILIVLTTIRSRDPEPTFKSSTLSQWTAKLGKVDANRGIYYVSPGEGADEAIHAFGTNAIPFLIKWISHETPTWKKAADRVLPNWFRQSALGSRALNDPGEAKAYDAMYGLYVLRGEAQSAIPTLGMMMLDQHHPYAAARAAGVLQCSWPSAFQAVDEVRRKPNTEPAHVLWFPIIARHSGRGEAVPSIVTNLAALAWLKGLTNAPPR